MSMLIESLSNTAVANRALEEHARKACLVANVAETASSPPHALIRVLGGEILMYVDLRDVSVAARLACDGFWEMGVTRFIARRLRPGSFAVDVGANFGYYTLLMAKLGAGAVCALEPNPWPAMLLEKSCVLNGVNSKVECHRVAAWSEHAALKMSSEQQLWGGIRVVTEDAPGTWTTPAAALDALLLNGVEKVDFVKIDAEGSEPEIWKGMKKIRENPALQVVMEWNMSLLKDPGAFAEEIVSDGFDIHLVENDGGARRVSPMDLVKRTELEMLYLVRP